MVPDEGTGSNQIDGLQAEFESVLDPEDAEALFETLADWAEVLKHRPVADTPEMEP